MAVATSNSSPATTARRSRPRVYYGWYIVSGALIAQFISAGIQVYVNGVFLVPMTESLNWTRTDYTMAQTIGPFFAAGAGFLIGSQIDSRGARPLMMVGVTLMAISLFLMAEITELWQWLLLRGVLMAIGCALVGSLVVNVTLSKWFVERRGRAIGIAAMGTSLAGIVLAPISTAVVDTWGWPAGWRVLAVIALLMIYPTAMIMRRQPEDHGLHPDGKSAEQVLGGGADAAAQDLANSLTRSEALRTRSLYMLVIAFGLAGAGMVTILLHAIPFLTDLGHSRTLAVSVISGSAIPAALSKPAWGYMAERYRPNRLASVSFVLLSFGVLTLLFGGHSGSNSTLGLSALILGLGWGGTIPIGETVWAAYFGRRHLGAVRSVAMPFSMVFSGGTPLLTSYYFDRVGNYDGALLGVAAAWALAAIVIALSRKPTLPARLRQENGLPMALTAPHNRISIETTDTNDSQPMEGPESVGSPRRKTRGRDYMGNGPQRPSYDYMKPDDTDGIVVDNIISRKADPDSQEPQLPTSGNRRRV